MKEPQSLQFDLNVLITMDERTFLITREQSVQIARLIDHGQTKQLIIGNDVVILHQIVGMPSLSTYRRQMKTKLAEKHQRMCRRCGDIMHMQDRCTCIERNALPMLTQAAMENPTLRLYFEKNGMTALALPPPKVEEPLMLPPTDKEKNQMAVIKRAKDKLLGHVEMPL